MPYSTYDPFSRVGLNGHYPVANRMYNPEKPSDGALEALCAEVQDGPIGLLYWWDASRHAITSRLGCRKPGHGVSGR